MRMAMIVISIALAHSFAIAQPDDARNAATWYRRAIEKYHSIPFSDDESTAVSNFEGDTIPGPSPQVRQVLSRFQPVIELVNRATAQRDCDFQLDLSNGPVTDYQSFSDMRRLARMLRYDMCVRIYDGDASAAGERAAGVYQIGNQLKNDGRYVGSIVSCALFHFGENLATELTDHAMLGPEQASKILAAVDSIDADDPFGFQQSIRNERENVIEWAREQFSGEGGVEKLAQNCDWLIGVNGARVGEIDPVKLATIAGMSQESLESSLSECSRMMDVVATAFANPDSEKAEADLKELDERLKDADCSPLTSMIMSRGKYASMHKQMLDTRQKIAERRAMLKSVIDGKFDAKATANAAIWYLRARLAISQLDQAMLDRVREYSKAIAEPPDESVRDFLASKDVQGIFETLFEASQIKRCDFQAASPWEGLFPAYQPGLRDAARLLVAEAAAALHHDDKRGADVAVDRLAICLAMGAHLSTDKLALSAVIAHENFKPAALLADQASNAGEVTNEHRATLKTALANVNPADPFGYERSLAATRESLRKWFGHTIQNDDQEVLDAVNGLMAQADADRLIWLMAIAHRSAERDRPPSFDVAGRWRHCAACIDLEALQAAIDHAMDVRNMIARGESDRVLEMPYPNIASIAARSRQAAEDLRRFKQMIDRSPSE